MAHFAIIDVGKAGYRIVPLTPDANSYIAQCRGMLTYSKKNIAKSAAKRMEEIMERRKKCEVKSKPGNPADVMLDKQNKSRDGR